MDDILFQHIDRQILSPISLHCAISGTENFCTTSDLFLTDLLCGNFIIKFGIFLCWISCSVSILHFRNVPIWIKTVLGIFFAIFRKCQEGNANQLPFIKSVLYTNKANILWENIVILKIKQAALTFKNI